MIPSGKIKNFHLLGIKIIIFLIPVLPLYVSSSMAFPYITGKNFAFRILVEFAAALWLSFIFIYKEYRLRNSAITLSILTFTCIVGLADLL
jgi:branched-subunit amino acid transport protein